LSDPLMTMKIGPNTVINLGCHGAIMQVLIHPITPCIVEPPFFQAPQKETQCTLSYAFSKSSFKTTQPVSSYLFHEEPHVEQGYYSLYSYLV
jgi:hypothetical protein